MLTVLIATRDGAPTLPRVLDAYCRLLAPEGGWRLLIVDNGSVDGTAALLDGYTRRLPLRRLHEPRPGKNVALNHALEIALEHTDVSIHLEPEHKAKAEAPVVF